MNKDSSIPPSIIPNINNISNNKRDKYNNEQENNERIKKIQKLNNDSTDLTENISYSNQNNSNNTPLSNFSIICDLSDSDSDCLLLSDSESNNSILWDSNYDDNLEPIETNRETYYRTNRLLDNLKENKVLIKEIILYTNNIQTFSYDELLCYYAIISHLSSINSFKICKDSNNNNICTLLCISCSKRYCLSFCPFYNIMNNIKSTLEWLRFVKWRNDNYDLVVEPNYNKWMNSLQEYINNTKLNNIYITEPNIVKIITGNIAILCYFTNHIHSYSNIHKICLQRAVYRLITFELSNITYDDSFILIKLIYLLAIVKQYKDVSKLKEYWDKLKLLSELDNILTFDNNTQILIQFIKDIHNININKLSQIDNNNNNNMNLYTKEQQNNPWSINIKYIENAVYNPKINSSKACLFFTIKSRQIPKILLDSLFKLLSNELNITIKTEDYYKNNIKSIYKIKGSLLNNKGFIIGYVDSWDCGNVHFYINIQSKELDNIIKILENHISLLFNIKKTHITLLEYNITEIEKDEIIYTFITGDNPKNKQCLYPSTLCIGTLNNEEIIRCMITYCHNFETFVNGPTIQLFSVHSDYRNQGYGSDLFSIIENEYLQFWYSYKDKIKIYISYITNAHKFILNQGYKFYDSKQEEAVKVILRT